MKTTIIFVCNGNMHRSPIAERIFRRELEKRGYNSIEVDSYGLHGFILPPPRGKCLKDYPTEYMLSKPHLDKKEINMENHLSKPLTEEVLKRANLIVTMHPDVNKLLLEKCPQFKNKTFLITNLCANKVILKDVDGSNNPKIYEETINNTELCVLESFNKIIELSKINAAKKGAKVATLPGINEKIMKQSMLADYNKVEEFTKKVYSKVKSAKNISIQTPSGTVLVFSVKGRKWSLDTGKIRGVGNLPGGEVFIAPLEGTTNGRMVIDQFKNDKEVFAQKKTVITIKNGNAVNVSDKKCKIAKLFNKIKNGTNIAEFGIGTNYKAKLIGNILQDEKAVGTCHIAFGSNFSMGGKIKTDMHIDTILRSPTIVIDGKVIIKKGKLV